MAKSHTFSDIQFVDKINQLSQRKKFDTPRFLATEIF